MTYQSLNSYPSPNENGDGEIWEYNTSERSLDKFPPTSESSDSRKEKKKALSGEEKRRIIEQLLEEKRALKESHERQLAEMSNFQTLTKREFVERKFKRHSIEVDEEKEARDLQIEDLVNGNGSELEDEVTNGKYSEEDEQIRNLIEDEGFPFYENLDDNNEYADDLVDPRIEGDFGEFTSYQTPSKPKAKRFATPTSASLAKREGFKSDHSVESKGKVSGNRSFFERSVRWKEQKEEKIGEAKLSKKEEEEEEEMKECSFKPSVNPLSLKLAPKEKTPVSVRLLENRKKLQEREKQRKRNEEAEVEATCTFKPVVNRYSGPVRSRWNDLTPPRPKVPIESPTFTPKTNKVSRTMNSAQIYLQSNPFQRLSAPRGSPPQKSNESSLSDHRTSLGTKCSGVGSSHPRRASTGSGKKSEEFWKRQEIHLERKKETAERVREATDKPFKPQLSQKSLEMTKEKGDFHQRLDRFTRRLEEKVTKGSSLTGEKGKYVGATRTPRGVYISTRYFGEFQTTTKTIMAGKKRWRSNETRRTCGCRYCQSSTRRT